MSYVKAIGPDGMVENDITATRIDGVPAAPSEKRDQPQAKRKRLETARPGAHGKTESPRKYEKERAAPSGGKKQGRKFGGNPEVGSGDKSSAKKTDRPQAKKPFKPKSAKARRILRAPAAHGNGCGANAAGFNARKRKSPR